mgnify:CR=1 FL=1
MGTYPPHPLIPNPPQFGFGGVDNGFMSFDHLRIPRDAMLMRFSKVRSPAHFSSFHSIPAQPLVLQWLFCGCGCDL